MTMRMAILLPMAVALMLCGAFIRFVAMLPRNVADTETRTDAVVVLTGGPARVREGSELMRSGTAQRMFISGVGSNVTRMSLLQTLTPPGSSPDEKLANLFACCVDLGLTAGNTAGNAVETAEWMREKGHNSLRLVTAYWHMPRSLVEFNRRLKGETIIPHPAFPANVSLDEWFLKPRVIALLGGEFSKYLFARLRAKGEMLVAEAPLRGPIRSEAKE